MLALFGGAALIVAVLAIGRLASAPPEDLAAEDHLERSERFAAGAPNPEPAAPAPALETIPVASAGFAAPVVEEPPAKPVVKAQPKRVVAKSIAKSPAKSPAPVIATPVAKAPAKRELVAASVTVPVPNEAAGFPPVTVTGCLEATPDGDEFRLTDTDGVDAPKSRSWKTGFLKKRPAPVALLGLPDPHGLQRQVGKRVSATGQLVDRDMKVSSIRVVGQSCD
jgi:hypothetical protein